MDFHAIHPFFELTNNGNIKSTVFNIADFDKGNQLSFTKLQNFKAPVLSRVLNLK